MDAVIAIPDLDDDQIYPLGDNFDDTQPPRPFRGAAAAQEHSRSGSGVSHEGSSGSRGGVGAGVGANGSMGGSGSFGGSSYGLPSHGANGTGSGSGSGSSSSLPRAIHGSGGASGCNAPGAASAFAAMTPTLPSFPRKPSFASLKAAFNKGPNTPTQDAYPSQLRNPFSNSATKMDPNAHASSSRQESDATPRMHSRQDSFLSSSSRGRAPLTSSLRHVHQGSQFSEQSHAASMSTSDSTSTSGHAFRKAVGAAPPLPPFPEGIQEEHGRGYDQLPSENSRILRRDMSDASIALPNNFREYDYDADAPLMPPNLPFAGPSHGRGGSSSGSQAMSEDAPRTSGEDYAARQMHGSSMYANRENASVASLPSGVGLDNPKTPAEYAINVLCSRFVTLAGVRVRGAIGGVDEPDPPLAFHLGKGANEALDALIEALAHVSQKSPRPVVDSLLQWRVTVMDERIDVGDVRGALAGSHAGLSLGVKSIADVLLRRKALATAYLLARALTQVASHFTSGGADAPVKGLSDAQLAALHDQAFNLMRECSRDRCPPSKMQGDAFEAAAVLLGELTKSSFVAIGDRFVAYLEQCQRAQASAKDADGPTETAIWAIRHLRITPYPMELFEEGAEFFETIAKFFSNSHGQKTKNAYAEALTSLILPVAKSASAELHHPIWIRALDSIGPRAFAMLQKPRYWAVAYPLYVAVLCVSPEERFLQSTQMWSWVPCLDAGVSKIGKDRALRGTVLNTSMWLLWTYLYRCRESSTTTTKRMESFFKIWFPPQKSTVWPLDLSSIGWHVYMVHYALYRQFDFGRDLCLDMLRHSALSGNTLSLQPELLSKHRMLIAVKAVCLTLDAHVKGESPPFPAESSFDVNKDGLGDELAEGFTYPTAEIGAAQAKFNDLIGKIALLCDHQVGQINVMDDSVTLTKGTSAQAVTTAYRGTADEDRLQWRHHEGHRFVAAYAKEHQPVMDLLIACIESWPRCLSTSTPFASVLAILFRAQFSADPRLSSAAVQCMQRIAKQRKGGAVSVLSSYMRSLVRLQSLVWETHPRQLLILSKVERAVKLLVTFLEMWLEELKVSQARAVGQKGLEMERTSAWAVIDEVEAIGLFLLCSAWRPLRRQAIAVLRAVADLDDVFVGTKRNTTYFGNVAFDATQEPTRIIHLLSMPVSRFSMGANTKGGSSQARSSPDPERWKRSTSAGEILMEIAESDKSSEANTWLDVVPRFLRSCLEHFPTTVAVFRSIVTSRVFGMENAASLAAGISSKAPAHTTTTLKSSSAAAASNLMSFAVGASASSANSHGKLSPEQILMSEHWSMYVLALCTTTTSIEGGAQRLNKGESSSERVFAAKDLFQKMVPYLASDQPRFQQAVIVALGNVNVNLYKTLLETVQMVNSQLSDDFKRSGSRRDRNNERLRTALAQVVRLTSPHMTREGILEEQAIVLLILQWTKDTFNFLTDREVRADWEFHELRRYFAGVVEDFFDALQQNQRAGNDAAERFLTFDTKLRMFRLFREWHSYSQAAKDGPANLTNLLATAAEQHRDSRNREQILMGLRTGVQLLSLQASSAMAALCQGALSLSNGNSGQQGNNGLDPRMLVEWLEYLFRSTTIENHNVASRALRALLEHNISSAGLTRLTLEQSFQEPETRSASRSFFAVFSDVIVARGLAFVERTLTWQQIACLGLIKLGHPDRDTRKKAFAMLNCIVLADAESTTMHHLEGGVSSPLPATYLRAQRDVSTHLANCFAQRKVAMLCEYTLRLPDIDVSRRATTLGLLPEWLHNIRLTSTQEPDGIGIPLQDRPLLILSNLLAITVRYGDEHNFEIQDMWSSLAESDDYAANAVTIVKFLIQQALIIRSSALIMHAKRAVSSLSHTVLSDALFSELCNYIEPSSMIPVPLEQQRQTKADQELSMLYKANLEALLPVPSRRQTFSPGQVALLYVAELIYEKRALLVDKLPLLIHAIFMQVDSLSAFTQEQVMAMFEQLMRSLSNQNAEQAYSEHAERLLDQGTSIFWTQDDEDFDDANTLTSMRATITDTLALLEPLLGSLKTKWGSVALHWATSNPVRHMACRSFQLFRVLLPDIDYAMLADILGRLSNTVSDSIRIDNQSFALEILYTLNAIVSVVKLNNKNGKEDILSHIYWMTVACLSTANEAEYALATNLMLSVLDCIDLNSRDTVSLLKSKCPEAWEGDMEGLQGLVMRGLKSSNTCDDSIHLLSKLALVDEDDLIEMSDSRVGYVFMACMPWFLQSTEDPTVFDEGTVSSLAESIGRLAVRHKQADIERIASSIAKKRFRTKDDLLRQAVSSCKRTGFIPKHTTGVAFLLLGFTFNSLEWMRRQTLQLLKILFQSLDAKRRDLDEYGPELLMPLLRLLSTKHSMEALEVLEEKILSGGSSSQQLGPNAQQILRMSLQWHRTPATNQIIRRGTRSGRGALAGGSRSRRESQMRHRSTRRSSSNGGNEANSLFGIPDESGWSVKNVHESTTRTRINIMSVFKEVELLLDTAPVGEVNFVDEYEGEGENVFERAMSASRIDPDDESASYAHSQRNLNESYSINGGHMAGDQQPTPPSAFLSGHARHGNDSIGDIVNQLHDLSSFFIDDDTGSVRGEDESNTPQSMSASASMQSRGRNSDSNSPLSSRRNLFWGSSSQSHGNAARNANGDDSSGEVAKVLSRSALAAMIGRSQGGRVISGASDDSQGTPTPLPHDSYSNGSASQASDYLNSKPVAGDDSTVKRSSMFVRKSLFGRKGTPTSKSRMAADATDSHDQQNSHSSEDAMSGEVTFEADRSATATPQ